MTYSSRPTGRAPDGSPTFATDADRASEEEVAALLERAWGCELRRFGHLAPIDWYAVRHGRLVGLVELKTRSHPVGRFPTVFLNVRKWLALLMGQSGLGVPAVFVVRWTDEVRAIPVAEVDASRTRIGGCAQVVKARSDVEPVVEVDVAKMRRVG